MCASITTTHHIYINAYNKFFKYSDVKSAPSAYLSYVHITIWNYHNKPYRKKIDIGIGLDM